MVAAKRPGEYLDTVIPLEELVELLAPFGMIVTLDSGAEPEYQAMQMSHALVGSSRRTPPAPRMPTAGPPVRQAPTRARSTATSPRRP